MKSSCKLRVNFKEKHFKIFKKFLSLETILLRKIKYMNHLLLHNNTKFGNLTSAHFTSQVGRLESSSDKWSNKVRNKFEPKCYRSQAKVTQRIIASTHYVKDVAFSLTMTPFWAPSSFRTHKMCVTGEKAFFSSLSFISSSASYLASPP